MSIKHSISYAENSLARITFTISKSESTAGYDKILAKYTAEAVLPGFRKGKVPKDVIIKRFGDGLKAEAIDEIIQKAISDVFPTMDRKPLPYAQPVLDGEPDLDFTKDLSFTICIDVEPSFTLPEYKGVEIEEFEITIGEADINKELDRLLEQNTIVSAKNGAIALGDLVTANFIELDALTGLDKKETARENFTFTAGDGKTYYEFDKDVVGMKLNEEKTLEKEFAKDHKEADLAGKKVSLKITITAVKEKSVPKLDDEFAKDVSDKFNTLQELKDDISTKLKTNAETSTKNRKINDLIKVLTSKATIELPQSMVKSESDMRFSNFARQSGLGEEQLAQMLGGNKEALSPNWIKECEDSVKGRLILAEILKQEKIKISDDEIKAKMDSLSKEYNMSIADMEKQFGSQFQFYIKNEIEDEKLHAYLLESAKITKKTKVSIEEFMQSANA